MLISKIISFEDINLETYIITGDSYDTPNYFVYENNKFDKDPINVNNIKGDGLIPLKTSELVFNNFTFMINGLKYKINKWKNVHYKKFLSKNDK